MMWVLECLSISPASSIRVLLAAFCTCHRPVGSKSSVNAQSMCLAFFQAPRMNPWKGQNRPLCIYSVLSLHWRVCRVRTSPVSECFWFLRFGNKLQGRDSPGNVSESTQFFRKQELECQGIPLSAMKPEGDISSPCTVLLPTGGPETEALPLLERDEQAFKS